MQTRKPASKQKCRHVGQIYPKARVTADKQAGTQTNISFCNSACELIAGRKAHRSRQAGKVARR